MVHRPDECVKRLRTKKRTLGKRSVVEINSLEQSAVTKDNWL